MQSGLVIFVLRDLSLVGIGGAVQNDRYSARRYQGVRSGRQGFRIQVIGADTRQSIRAATAGHRGLLVDVSDGGVGALAGRLGATSIALGRIGRFTGWRQDSVGQRRLALARRQRRGRHDTARRSREGTLEAKHCAFSELYPG